MAIVTTRLDGQTIGIQLSAPEISIDAIDLDMATGIVTSSYLTDNDLHNLKPGIDEIFSIVPYASRAAGALNILTKLVSSASVDASTVVATAVNIVGDIYALRLTPSIPTSHFILGLPYSATGGMAFALSGSVAGGGGGVNNVTASLPITSSGGANPNIALNPISNVNVAVGAAIDRLKLAAGTPNSIVANNGFGFMVDVAPLGPNQYLFWNGLSWTTATAGLQYWSESQTMFGGKTTDALLALYSVGPDADAALVAKGTGATLAQIPDGFTTGGNVRGPYATDLQKSRVNPDEVAFGLGSVIAGGLNNKATGTQGVVVGGNTNYNSSDYGFIGGGQSNTLAGSTHSVLVGGQNSTVFSDHSFVGTGFQNIVGAAAAYGTIVNGNQNNITGAQHSFIGSGEFHTENGGSYAFIGAGFSNTVSQDYGIVLGGRNNTSSFTYDSVLGGQNNTASGNQSVVVGGRLNIADGFHSVITNGLRTTTRGTTGRMVLGYSTSNVGAHQTSTLVLSGSTTDASVQYLTSNSSTPLTPSNILYMPDNSAFKLRAEVIARANPSAAGVGVQAWTVEALAYRDVGAASTVVTAVTSSTFGAGLAAATVTLEADVANGGVVVRVTGIVGTNIRWTATLFSSETTY